MHSSSDEQNISNKSNDNINSTNKKIIKRYNHPDKKTLCKREKTKHIISR